jgi:hypothetical protein
MKPLYFSPLFALLLLFSSSGANAAGSLLQVTCSGDDVGAAVTVDGKFKGECPVDMEIKEGAYKLRVEKNTATYDSLFEQNIRMGDGVRKKVEAVLSKRLNAAGQRAEDERLAAEAAAKAPKYVSQGGLIWMPVTFHNDWTVANNWCSNSVINGQTGWRLPTKNELIALYDSGAMKDQGWRLYDAWSSTPTGNGGHYFVRLDTGTVGGSGDADVIEITCVR